MVYYVITRGDIHGKEEVYVVSNPKIGGLFVDETITDKEKRVLIPFVGNDTDANTNVLSYSMDKKTWIIYKVNTEWGHNKGDIHATHYFTTSVKGKITARSNCTIFQAQLPCPTQRLKEQPYL